MADYRVSLAQRRSYAEVVSEFRDTLQIKRLITARLSALGIGRCTALSHAALCFLSRGRFLR